MENFNDVNESVNIPIHGAFTETLNRTNKNIRADRSAGIGEDAMINYKQTVESLAYDVTSIIRKRNVLLDLSPTNAQSLVIAGEFDGKAFVKEDTALSLDLREAMIKFHTAEQRLWYLFKVKVASTAPSSITKEQVEEWDNQLAKLNAAKED